MELYLRYQSFTIRPGDSLYKLFGRRWESFYNLPQNSEFRQKNPNPDIIKVDTSVLFPCLSSEDSQFEEVLDFYIFQNWKEINQLCDLAKDMTSIVEIGTGYGGTSFMLAAAMQGNGKVVTLDHRPQDIDPVKDHPFSSCIVKLTGNSIEDRSIEKIKEVLGCEVDMLFIDGDHRYEYISHDFYHYYPLIKDSGVIAMHDICSFRPLPNYDESDFGGHGTVRFWNEIKSQYKSMEIIDPKNERNMTTHGIGVIWKSQKL